MTVASSIPRTFHFVWLGGAMPSRFDRYVRQWQELHPGWQVRVWGDDDLGFLENRSEFDAAANFAEKADIARYEIVHREGGVYVDCDVEPLRNIEPLLVGAQFVVGEETPSVYAIGWFAGVPGHPVLRYVIDELPESFSARTGAPTNQRTGPEFFTRCVRRVIARDGLDVRVLPREALYPYSYTQGDLSHVSFPGAYAVHHWAKSWLPSSPSRVERSNHAVGRWVRGGARAVKSMAGDITKRWDRVEPRRHRPLPHATPVGESRLLVQTRGGFPIFAEDHDLALTPSLVVEGVYDTAFFEFLASELRHGDVVVDVGANIGFFTLQMAHRVGRTGRVVAIEPNPSCVRLLRDSLYMNQLMGLGAEVIVHEVAAGAVSEQRVLSARRSHRGRGSLQSAADESADDVETFSVSVVCLDELLAQFGFIRLVRIDVEGFEHAVLAGMTRLIDERRVQLIDIELKDVHAGSSWDPLCSLLRDLDRRPGVQWWTIDARGRRRPTSLSAAIHSSGMSHLLMELPVRD
jgi:FkbM family methyltransferase